MRSSVAVMLAFASVSVVVPILPAGAQTDMARVRFALAGDAIISQRLSPFEEPEYLALIDLIRGADLAFVNLEVLLHEYEDGVPAAHSGGTWMAAPPRMAKELAWAGFDMVSLANNHTMDWSAGGLRATISALEDADLSYAGAGENLARARAPGYREMRGGRVAVISVASTFADEHRAGAQRPDIRGRPGLSPLRYETTFHVSEDHIEDLRSVARDGGVPSGGSEGDYRFLGGRFVADGGEGRHTHVHSGDMTEIEGVIADARRQADWVIVTSHSHEAAETRDVPAEFIVEAARRAIDAGADMFVGHGPHVLRGIEIYNGKPIFYSLANFVFQNETIEFLPDDFYSQLGLDQRALPGEGFDRRNEAAPTGGFPADRIYWESVLAVPAFEDGRLTEIVLHPITLGFGEHRPQRGRPRLGDEEAGRRIIALVARLSEPFGTTVRYDAARNVGVIEP